MKTKVVQFTASGFEYHIEPDGWTRIADPALPGCWREKLSIVEVLAGAGYKESPAEIRRWSKLLTAAGFDRRTVDRWIHEAGMNTDGTLRRDMDDYYRLID